MLQYFPTPYPDELWYSVLGRYHVRSGNPNSATTFRELFGAESVGGMGNFLPNCGIRRVAEKLPEGVLDERDIALHHTLFPYTFRFQDLATKEKLLEKALSEKVRFPIKLPKPYTSTVLKYCPLCMREDRERYGEAYWHVTHQIPYVTICTKHRCRLRMKDNMKKWTLNDNLFLPMDEEEIEADLDITETEAELSGILVKYQELPIEKGPMETHNNLYEGLLNSDYGIARKDKNFSIDYKRVEADLLERFGKDFIEEHFGTPVMRAAIFGNVRNWNYKLPERYAILSTLIHQNPEVTFSEERLENKTVSLFLRMSKEPMTRSKKYVARSLGVKEKHLDILAHNLNVVPFWEQKPDAERAKEYRGYVCFTEDEWAYVQASVSRYGFQSSSAFIRFCVEQYRNREEVDHAFHNK